MFSPKGAGCSWKDFLRYVLPSVSAMLLFSLYTVVDGIFVARGVGAAAMTSVNLALPYVNTIYGFSVLISMGTATLVAFARGRGDQEEAETLFTQTAAIILIVSLFLSVSVWFFAPELAAFLGAAPEFIGGTVDYLRYVCGFSVCFILSYCLEVMVKVADKPVMAVVGAGASFLTNVFLDYLFIIEFGWGIKGAALATGLAQLASLIIFLRYFLGKNAKLKFRAFKPQPKALLRIFPLGVADCSVEMIVAFLTLIYNQVLLHTIGAPGQTIYAVLAYVSLFAFMVLQGVAQGMMHLVSFHIGKGEVSTARGYFRMALVSGLGISILFVAVCFLAPGLIASLLLDTERELIPQAVLALRLCGLSFPFAGLNVAIAGYLTARERPLPSIVLSLGRGFFFAPLALLVCAFLIGGTAIWCAPLLGELCCLLAALPILRRQTKKMALESAAHAKPDTA